jgi:hypothetical protein
MPLPAVVLTAQYSKAVVLCRSATTGDARRMALVHTTDTAPAAWLVNSRTPPQRLITFGPVGYEAYARLRYIPDPTSPGQLETDADIPDDHPLWLSQARRALNVLADFTETPDECFFCVWEGIAGDVLSARERQGPLVTVPHRRFVLFAGRLGDYTEAAEGRFDGDTGPVPAFVWPADHRWCFTSDVDTHWAGIGADRAAVETLLNTSGLDVVRARPDERPPAYR